MINGRQKLSAEQVKAIRRDGRVARLIAPDYEISASHVAKIKNRYRRKVR
jgi:hypothetical protein